MTITTPDLDREFLRTVNVLYVEDVDFSRESLAYYLQRRCNRVDIAGDGKTGLEMFSNNQYDVVLTDVRMPVMDGLEMLQHIKSAKKDVPVIVITALSDEETRTRAMAMGADSFITKPFFPENIAEEIYKCTRRNRATI